MTGACRAPRQSLGGVDDLRQLAARHRNTEQRALRRAPRLEPAAIRQGPRDGSPQARPNPEGEWVVEEVPALRIVSDELWSTVKDRQSTTRQAIVGDRGVRSERARRPHYLFSGLLTCGACGGGYTLVGARHYGCANTRNRGTCDNRLTIRRDVLEETVLRGLKDNLLQPELIHEFVATYQQEYNRLRRAQTNEQAAAHAELARVERQIRNIVEAVKAGLFASAMKDEMAALEERRAQLVGSMRDQVEEPPMLHPGLADVYRRKVEKLTQALNKEELRTEAAETLRSMIQAIRLVPEDGQLAIELARQYARIVHGWIKGAGMDSSAYGTHSMRRTKDDADLYRKTGNLRAVELLLGHTKIESTVRYLGIEVDDALKLSEQVEL